MGLNYSFTLLCERSRIDAVLAALAEHLVPEDRTRLLSALPWRPASETERRAQSGEMAVDARGIQGMPRTSSELVEHSHCFSLALSVAPEHRVEWPCRLEDGRTSIGCMWTSIRAGRRFASIEMSAATSDMSRLLEAGSDARSVFLQIASKGGTRALLFDREKELVEQLHPSPPSTSRGAGRWVERPDEERHCFVDDWSIDIDGGYREILRATFHDPN